ncbi:Pre-mRNA splicing, partial [Coemansia brasiliensis]
MSNEFTEEHKKLYQYAGNSNLVLPSDRSKIVRRGDRGKEIESLWNKIDPREMGANIRREAPLKPTQTEEQAERAYQRKQARRAQQQAKLNYGYTDILAASEDIGGTYRPQTQGTRQIWELMLSQIREYLGDQAPEVMLSAADEALGVFKNDELREAAKKQQIEQLFGAKVDDAVFSRLGQMAQQITDYNKDAEEADGAKMDVDEGDEDGIAVMFGGSDEEEQILGGDNEAPVGEVDDEESSDEDSQVGPPLPSQAEAGSESDASTEGDDAAGGYRTVIHGYNEKNAKALNR